MSVLDDITAELTTVLHTNTTHDITAAQVRTALIDAFTAILGAQVGPAQIAATADQVSLYDHSNDQNLVNVRSGQPEGLSGVYMTARADPVAVFPIGSYAKDKFLNNDGTLANVGGYCTSDYFPVLPGTQITISAETDSSNLVFFDAGLARISNVQGPYSDLTITVPASAYFARRTTAYFNNSWYFDNLGNFQVLEGTVSPLPHLFRTLPSKVHMHRPWTGKAWSFHGDSLTGLGGNGAMGNNLWTVLASQHHGVKSMHNHGIGGSKTADLFQQVSYSNPGDRTLPASYWASKDMVFSLMGANDIEQGVTIGTIDDATTAATFYGHYKKFIETVLTNNPYTRMVIATIPQSGGATRTTTDAYNTAVKALAKYYSIHLWNVGEFSQFSPTTFSALSNDSLHPSFNDPAFLIAPTGVGRPTVPKDVGSIQVFGSQFIAFMHTVFPNDYVGDPLALVDTHPSITDPLLT